MLQWLGTAGSAGKVAPQRVPVPKILVADDNTNIQKMVSLAFQERGIDVVAVGNGEAAVRRIPDLKPDLVLADIFMPVRNGYEVCEFVKKDERFSHVPVILLVGAFDPLDEKEARRVGADGVLKKPFVPPDPLIAMVVSALEKNPRVAAEMAKARETPPEPVEQPLPALEMPARAEVKPLPDFPEPSPEEAALVYGFGSGKRGLGNTAEEDKGPVAPKGEEVEEADDQGAATHDWRRSAMDFEIPEETSKSTAFALEDDGSAGMFPSERDVPPKHVSAKWRGGEIEKAIAADEPVIAKASEEPVTPSVVSAAPAASAFDAEITPVNLEDEAADEIEAKVPVHAEEPTQQVEAVAEPEVSAPAVHWMDAMAGGSDEPAQSASHDFASAKTIGFARPEPEPQPEHQQANAGAASPAAQAHEPVAPVEELPVQAAQSPVEQPVNGPADESFFADDAQAGADSVPVAAPEFHPLAQVDDPALESSGPVPVVAAQSDPEWEAEPEAGEPMGKDPDLFESPAVRVTPEPLLVSEAAAGPAQYGKPSEEMESPFEFMSEATSEAPASEVIDERIPTMVPPNREALADIPFLSPPPEILAESAAALKNNAAGDETVDAVVRKVMERLEPQLHDLLSQGVLKPLVENILQNDLAKKGR